MKLSNEILRRGLEWRFNVIGKKCSGQTRKTSQQQDREILRAVSTQKWNYDDFSNSYFEIYCSPSHTGKEIS